MSEKITSHEALDALPVTSVVRLDSGQVFARVDGPSDALGLDWQMVGSEEYWATRELLAEADVEAVILFRPDTHPATPADGR